ncbi:unnamed protein product [Ceutorhynchus assimilis]|uniref:G-protein coupled receptors family 2 profile 2 domain-containing protein n=1 Tax=Ceutorhynchus assimilis TaxID=467358 RepID=A0A9P0GM25_9CUCU|nr:unnamed protein product [Ceutorhynchus assimilis]
MITVLVFLVKIVLAKEVFISDNETDNLCSANNNCFRKCCPKGDALVGDECHNFYMPSLPDPLTAYFPSRNDYFLISGNGNFCSKPNTVPLYFMTPQFRFLENAVQILEEEDQPILQYPNFCLEWFVENGTSEATLGLLACLSTTGMKTYNYGMIISMPFLLATFLVYAILPDRNLHQRALMFYVLTLLISYMLLVTINLSENINRPWCEIFGYLTLYFFMVSFFWMNVICFDIWYTFSGGRGFVGSKRTSERKRLLLYSLYAFGVPLLVALLVLLLQSKVLSESSEHNPGIGINKCFLGDGWPNLWYFYLEAGLLVLMNIIFFTLTALKIRQVKKETSMLKHNDSQRHSYEKDKQKFNLYVKLLFAMGVNWSMEVISWLVNWRTGNNIQYIWWATDFFNAVYGVFIFFMFVFKKKIWKLLQRRFNWKKSQETVLTGTSPAPSTSNLYNNKIAMN